MSGLLDLASERLHASGGRMTAQRRLILEILDGIGGHPTADEVYVEARCRDATINPSTIYRTLNWLAENGLVSSQRLGAERQSTRKERFDPGSPAEHYHFVCVNCGEVIEFESNAIELAKNDFARQYGATVERASLTLHGLCAACTVECAPSQDSVRAGRNLA
jgi:Fe2+ or Zn2+ uptake regulation protein